MDSRSLLSQRLLKQAEGKCPVRAVDEVEVPVLLPGSIQGLRIRMDELISRIHLVLLSQGSTSTPDRDGTSCRVILDPPVRTPPTGYHFFFDKSTEIH